MSRSVKGSRTKDFLEKCRSYRHFGFIVPSESASPTQGAGPRREVTWVCQTIVRLPRCNGTHSPVTFVPTGAGAKKLVFDSIVVVLAPSRRLSIVAHAPRVSANAINAPPCKTGGDVQRSARTSISACTRSGAALTKRIPRTAANGKGLSLRIVKGSISALLSSFRERNPAGFIDLPLAKRTRAAKDLGRRGKRMASASNCRGSRPARCDTALQIAV